MKNLMVANLRERFNKINDWRKRQKINDLLNLLHAQIDNSLHFGWKPKDILVITNFFFKYKDVNAFSVPMMRNGITGSKSFAMEYIYKSDFFRDTIWVHDLDAWQVVEFDEPEFDHIGITGYNPNKLNGGSIFYKNTPQAKDLFFDALTALKKSVKREDSDGKEEPILNKYFVPKRNKKAEGVVKMLDQSYNLGCSSFVDRYNRAEKPIKVCHFHPTNRIAWDTFVRDRNRQGFRVIDDRMVDLFLTYFGGKIKGFVYNGERGFDGDWSPVHA